MILKLTLINFESKLYDRLYGGLWCSNYLYLYPKDPDGVILYNLEDPLKNNLFIRIEEPIANQLENTHI